MEAHTIIGVDPGMEGGIAFLFPMGDGHRHLDVRCMPVIKLKAAPRPGHKSARTIVEYDEALLGEALEPYANGKATVFIEKQQPMRRWDPRAWDEKNKRFGKSVAQGVVSMWNLCSGFMLLRGICVGLKIPYTIVPPKVWQSRMMAGIDRTIDTKVASISTAQRMYPGVDFRRSERCRVKCDGMTDAALIATYGWQTMFGGVTGWTVNKISLPG